MGNPAALALPGSDSESRELSYNFTALEAGNLPNQWQTIRRFNSMQTTPSSVETQHAASLPVGQGSSLLPDWHIGKTTSATSSRCLPKTLRAEIFFMKLAKAVGELLVPPPALTRLHAGLLEPCMGYPCFGLIFPAIGPLLDSLVDSLVEVAPEFRHLTAFPPHCYPEQSLLTSLKVGMPKDALNGQIIGSEFG